MKLNLTEKDISILKVVSQIAGGFTLIVALTMIFSLDSAENNKSTRQSCFAFSKGTV